MRRSNDFTFVVILSYRNRDVLVSAHICQAAMLCYDLVASDTFCGLIKLAIPISTREKNSKIGRNGK